MAITTEEFIKRARKLHGDKYDYSKVEYKNANAKVCIICPIHGEFWQTPSKHTNCKHGCPKCGSKERLSNDEFIKRAREIHGDKYKYDESTYGKRVDDDIRIICPEHGEFWQNPRKHINGCSCPKCSLLICQ